jgi:hypothetical protein
MFDDEEMLGRDTDRRLVQDQQTIYDEVKEKLDHSQQRVDALVEIIESQKQLLIAYRLGDHVRADRALTRLEKAEQALATVRATKGKP